MPRFTAALLLPLLAAACAADQPPDPATLMHPQEVLQLAVGNTMKSRSSQTAGVTFYESAQRTRFRTRILSNGTEFTDGSTVTIQGEALCSTPDTVFDKRTFCSRFYRTPTGFRTAPTDNRPGSMVELLPGNPESL